MQQQIEIMNTNVIKCEKTIDDTIQSIFEFKNKVTMDIVTNQ